MQDAGRKVVFKGEGQLKAAITDSPVDLRLHWNAASVIEFDFRMIKAPEEKVTMRVDCGWPCNGELNITDQITKPEFADGEWHKVKVPVKCFQADFSKVDAAFLFSASDMTASFANIRWVPGETGNITCD